MADNLNKLILLGIILFSSIVSAQTVTLQKSVLCGDHVSAVTFLTSEYGELPIWKGKTSMNTEVIFFLNPQNNSWTLIETNGTLACSIAVGNNIEVLNRVKQSLTFQ